MSAANTDFVCTGESYRCPTTIDMLTGDVLLDIFVFYRNNHDYSLRLVWEWDLLAHVCRKWRQIIFESPHRLNLQILCTHKTPVMKNLGIWPAFPLVIDYNYSYSRATDNVIAALGHPDRVCYVKLTVTDSQLAPMAALMLERFPLLTHLYIYSEDRSAPVFTTEFLGGSAPRLQELGLSGISYPALPRLLLSASGLVTLRLHNISAIGYISPETVVRCLAALPQLETLIVGFRASYRPSLSDPFDSTSFFSSLTASSPDSLSDQILPPLVTQKIVLPALTDFQFKGGFDYLEDIIPHIDCPRLEDITIECLYQYEDLEVARLSKFIDRSVGPFSHAYVSLLSSRLAFNLDRHANHKGWGRHTDGTSISFAMAESHVFEMTQVLSQFSVAFSTIIHLELKVKVKVFIEESTSNVDWLHLLRQFPAMQMLYVSREHARVIALALEDIKAEMVAEELPSLALICLEGQPASFVEKFEFVAARRLTDHPVTVVDTRNEFDKKTRVLP